MNLVGLIFFPLTKRYYYKFCLSWVMVCGFLGLPLLLVANSMDIQISQALFVSWAFIIGFIFSIFFPELKENTLEIKLDGMIAAKLVVMAIVTYLVVQNPESVTLAHPKTAGFLIALLCSWSAQVIVLARIVLNFFIKNWE